MVMQFDAIAGHARSPDPETVLNVAAGIQRPLRAKGEPGTATTALANQTVSALKQPLVEWHAESTAKQQNDRPEYDVQRPLRTRQLRAQRVRRALRQGKPWLLVAATTHAFVSSGQR